MPEPRETLGSSDYLEPEEDTLVESEVEIQPDSHFADSAELIAHAVLNADTEPAQENDELLADIVDTMEAALAEDTAVMDKFDQVRT